MKIILLFILISFNSIAAMWASIEVPRAIIYADKQMSSPIGYFRKGVKIRVGDKVHNKGSVFATTYQRKIVFIRVADTKSSRDQRLTTSASQRVGDVSDYRPSTQMLALSLSSWSLTLSEGGQNLDSSVDTTFGAFSLDYYKKFSADHIDIKLSANWLNFNDSASDINLLDLSFDYVNYIINNKYFRVAAVAGINALPFVSRNYDDEFDSSGYGLGLNIGSELHSKAFKGAIFILGFNYKYLQAFGFQTPSKAKKMGLEIDSSLNLSGYSLYGSVGFKF